MNIQKDIYLQTLMTSHRCQSHCIQVQQGEILVILTHIVPEKRPLTRICRHSESGAIPLPIWLELRESQRRHHIIDVPDIDVTFAFSSVESTPYKLQFVLLASSQIDRILEGWVVLHLEHTDEAIPFKSPVCVNGRTKHDLVPLLPGRCTAFEGRIIEQLRRGGG